MRGVVGGLGAKATLAVDLEVAAVVHSNLGCCWLH